MDKYSFKCKDIGMDCGFSTEGKSMDDLMPKIVAHAKEAHSMTSIPLDLREKINNAVKVLH